MNCQKKQLLASTKKIMPVILLAVWSAMIAGISPCNASTPNLTSGVLISAGSNSIAVAGGYAAPDVVDWNNDGKLDLITGQFNSGKACLFLNEGSRANPVFSASSFIQANGTDITTSYGGSQGAAPRVVDWNSDSNKDLLIGEDGVIRIYLNQGTDAAPSFTAFSYIQLGAANFTITNQAMPEITDWNEDGKKDLLCGEINGRIYLLLNTGTESSPVFTNSVFIQDGVGNLGQGSYSSPVVVDWDGDGKKDLLVGTDAGGVIYYTNIGVTTQTDIVKIPKF